MPRYRLALSYDGTAYAGWQIQRSHPTVQDSVQQAVARTTGETAIVHGSGRTDQGVHARLQVAHFDLAAPFVAPDFQKSLNAVLPADIRVLSVNPVGVEFHARYSVVLKEYRYFVWNGDVVPPFLRLYRTHIRQRLDTAAMSRATERLKGLHDFAAFAANPDREVESTVRNLTDLTVRRRGAEVSIAAECDGFLYRMVRSLAGFLIKVGQGIESPEHADEILKSGVRTARVPTAPAQGLFLWNVVYPGTSR